MQFLDLANKTDSHFVVDQEDDVYLGHPSTIINNRGELLCFYPQGHGRGAILAKKSVDLGKTWSDRLKTPTSWVRSQETPIVYKLRDKIILLSGRYPSKLSYSLDDGDSWSEFVPFNWGGLVVFSSLIELPNGKYVAFFHDNGKFFQGKGERGPFTLYQVTSDDGVNWTFPKKIYVCRQGESFCEPFAIYSPSGKQVLLLLRNNFKKYSFGMTSDDYCKTWNNPFQLNLYLSGDRHVGDYLPNGELYISFRCKNPKWDGDWCSWVGSYEDIVQGRDGRLFIRMMENMKRIRDGLSDCAYPSVHVKGDLVINTTYGSWYTKNCLPWVICTHTKMDQLV